MPRDLTPGDGQDVLARFKAAREQRDVDAVLSLLAEDAEFRPDPFEPPLLGAVAIRGYWNDIAAAQLDVDFDAERVWVSGLTILASWHAAWTRISDGDRIRERGFSTLELDASGAVTRWRTWAERRIVAGEPGPAPEWAPSGRMEAEHGR